MTCSSSFISSAITWPKLVFLLAGLGLPHLCSCQQPLAKADLQPTPVQPAYVDLRPGDIGFAYDRDRPAGQRLLAGPWRGPQQGVERHAIPAGAWAACVREEIVAQLGNDDGDANTPPLFYYVALTSPQDALDAAAGSVPLTADDCRRPDWASAYVRHQWDTVTQIFDAQAQALGSERPRSADWELPQPLIDAVKQCVQTQSGLEVLRLSMFKW